MNEFKPWYICPACGRQADDHALCLDENGVVTAGTWRTEDDFLICADHSEQLKQLRRELRAALDTIAAVQQALGRWNGRFVPGVDDEP